MNLHHKVEGSTSLLGSIPFLDCRDDSFWGGGLLEESLGGIFLAGFNLIADRLTYLPWVPWIPWIPWMVYVHVHVYSSSSILWGLGEKVRGAVRCGAVSRGGRGAKMRYMG